MKTKNDWSYNELEGQQPVRSEEKDLPKQGSFAVPVGSHQSVFPALLNKQHLRKMFHFTVCYTKNNVSKAIVN